MDPIITAFRIAAWSAIVLWLAVGVLSLLALRTARKACARSAGGPVAAVAGVFLVLSIACAGVPIQLFHAREVELMPAATGILETDVERFRDQLADPGSAWSLVVVAFGAETGNRAFAILHPGHRIYLDFRFFACEVVRRSDTTFDTGGTIVWRTMPDRYFVPLAVAFDSYHRPDAPGAGDVIVALCLESDGSDARERGTPALHVVSCATLSGYDAARPYGDQEAAVKAAVDRYFDILT